MNIVKRRRRIASAVAILLPIAVVGLGIAAWNDAGVQPVTQQTVSIPLPELSK
ncbi:MULTISPECIES: hypothetical protein [Sphingomonadaceae]|uniref:hypothetical protein n=1 Tax=Sphingomonadaceae TaxID=41297 RepID=UPI0012DC0AC6|nr:MULTISPECIES: hypothetical protein [Sphingomonadaceae]MBF7011041.1 hypothetical protein [Novosphingobium sp. HR1a]WJM29034.1 hypothetical protein QUC32_15335 [Novosphingobium resinovorum]